MVTSSESLKFDAPRPLRILLWTVLFQVPIAEKGWCVGLGTVIASWTDVEYHGWDWAVFITGILQFGLAWIIIGWAWSIWWGVRMFQDADARQKKQEALESQELVHDSTVHISAEEQQVPNNQSSVCSLRHRGKQACVQNRVVFCTEASINKRKEFMSVKGRIAQFYSSKTRRVNLLWILAQVWILFSSSW